MKNSKSTIIVFTLMNFVLSMAGFVFSGILDKVAAALSVSVASAGLLNSMHAYGAAIGVPLTLIVFRRVNRVRMLKVMLLLSVLLNVLLVLSRGFNTLLALRLLSGVTMNSYGVLGTATVVALASRERLGRSLALLIAGNSLALVVGIPFTRAISSAVDWRAVFWALSALMALSLLYFQFNLKPAKQEPARLDLKGELGLLKNPKVYLIFLFTFVMFLGYHGAYNYVTPYLLNLFPAAEPRLSLFLVLFGLGSFTGNYLGGRVSDRIGYARSLRLGAMAQALVVLLMLIFQGVLWATVALIACWVMSSWFMGLQLNAGVASETGNRSSFLLSLTGSSIQLGSAVGSSLAALMIAGGLIRQMILMSLLTACLASLLAVYLLKKHHNTKEWMEETA